MCDQFKKVNRKYNSNKEGKDQESIQSSTTPDPGYQWENNKVSKGAKVRNQYQTRESQEVSHFPAGDHKASITRHARQHNKHKPEMT